MTCKSDHPQRPHDPVVGLNADERAIAELLVSRLHAGRAVYGPWRLDTERRSLPREALLEVIDALHYTAAALLRLERALPTQDEA